MTKENKIALLENRLNNLKSNNKDNNGIQRKLERQLRNLKKQLTNPKGCVIIYMTEIEEVGRNGEVYTKVYVQICHIYGNVAKW